MTQDRPYTPPVTIMRHSAVKSCEQITQGLADPQTLHHVRLYPGWVFDWREGRGDMTFKTVAEFSAMPIIPDPEDENGDNMLKTLIDKAHMGAKSPITEGMKMALGVLMRSPIPCLTSADVRDQAMAMVHKDADREVLLNASKAGGGLGSLKRRGVVFSRKVSVPGEYVIVPGRYAGQYTSGFVPVPAKKNMWFLNTRADEVRTYMREQRKKADEMWPETLEAYYKDQQRKREILNHG